jgi:hypothetical protein
VRSAIETRRWFTLFFISLSPGKRLCDPLPPVRIDSEGSPKWIAQLPPRGGFDRVGFRDLVVVGRLSPLFFDGTAGNPKHLGYLLLLFLSVPPPARIEAGRCSTHCFYSIHDKKAKPYKQRDKSWHKQDEVCSGRCRTDG